MFAWVNDVAFDASVLGEASDLGSVVELTNLEQSPSLQRSRQREDSLSADLTGNLGLGQGKRSDSSLATFEIDFETFVQPSATVGRGRGGVGKQQHRARETGNSDDLLGLDDASAIVSSQSLDAAEYETLLYIREEEKLAHDVYQTFADLWDKQIFANIAQSEINHQDAVLKLYETYGITDTADDNAVGEFDIPELQQLYNDLVAQGSESLQAALEVGVYIEETDLIDLQEGIDETDNPDIQNVYSNLLKGSENHLSAFLRVLGQ